MNRPNFIILGAMKSATSTLQKQLVMQPNIFMTTPKEPNYFSNDEVFQSGEQWYSDLYKSAATEDLVGEASTHYTKLPRYPETVARAQAYAPGAKLIYVMRHPIDRLVSHYIHNWTQGFVGKNVGIEEALESYENFVSYSCYEKQIKPWIDAYGADNVLPVFFDRLRAFPQTELERVCKFIGYQGEVRWVESEKADNVSSERVRKFPLYSLLVESKAATWARSFVPRGLREKAKSRLRMQARPELSDDTVARLTAIFDADLGMLGTRLGVQLNCGNFKSCTRESVLDWVER